MRKTEKENENFGGKKIVVEEKNGKEKGGPHLEAAIISWGEKKIEKEKEENNLG